MPSQSKYVYAFRLPPPSPFFLYLDRSDTFLIFYDPRSGSNAYCFNGEVLLNNFS